MEAVRTRIRALAGTELLPTERDQGLGIPPTTQEFVKQVLYSNEEDHV